MTAHHERQLIAHPDPSVDSGLHEVPSLSRGPVEGWSGTCHPAAHSCRWEILDLGEIDYGRALSLQEKCRDAVEAGHPGFWLLLQHPPVVTAGRREESMADLACGPEALHDLGVQLARTDRGGRLTFHHPGQIVGYPILSLRRERWKLRTHIDRLAAIIAEALAPFGIDARFRPDHPGLWVDVEGAQKKIASIGVHVRRSVTTHGFALHVRRPSITLPGVKLCGLAADRITSMENILAYPPDLDKVKHSLMNAIDRMGANHA